MVVTSTGMVHPLQAFLALPLEIRILKWYLEWIMMTSLEIIHRPNNEL